MSVRTPIARHATLLAGATTTLTFALSSTVLGTAHIKNLGPGAVAVKFDGVPLVPPADNQFTLESGDSYNVDSVNFSTIGLRAVGDCEVQVIAYLAAQGDIR